MNMVKVEHFVPHIGVQTKVVVSSGLTLGPAVRSASTLADNIETFAE